MQLHGLQADAQAGSDLLVGQAGADDGNVTGARRFHAFVGAVRVVHLVFATPLAKAPRWEGTLGQTRLGPVAEALHQPDSVPVGG
jgi:hypothetical protein